MSASTTSSSRPTTRPTAPVPWTRRALLLAVLVALVWSWLAVDIPLTRLLEAPGKLLRIAQLMFVSPSPDWSYFGRAMEGMIESIQMAWLGTLIAATFSLPLGLLAAKNVTGQASSNVARQVLNGFRAVPELVLAILFVAMVGLGAVPGMLAIGIHSIGTLGKLTSEVVEGIDAGPLEAVDAVGGRWLERMRWGVIPQAMPEIVAFWLYRFEINIRASAILGAVGAGGVGSVLANTVSYRRWDKAGMALIVVVVATLMIDFVSGRIRHRIIQGAPAERREGELVTEAM